jgi:hypothetical protein
MDHMNTRTRMMDDGTISPKVAIPTALLALAGIILAVLDSTGVLALEDGVWIALLSAGGVTFGTGYAARPGPVVPDPEAVDVLKGVRGLTLLETIVVLLVVGLLLLAVIVLT